MSRSFTVRAGSFNAYLNWLFPAIAGVTPAAEAVLRAHEEEVHEFAALLREMLGTEPKRLYRGVLLEPSESGAGILYPDPERRFISWTEDRDVACWFADPASHASGNLRDARPLIEGFLVEHLPQPAQVLFHHAWARRFPMPDGRLGHLSQLASFHELIDVRELEWQLGTRSDVITLSIESPMVLLEPTGAPDTRMLDARLVPPPARPTG